MSEMARSVLLLLLSVFLSSVSQILLKKAARKTYKNRLFEYLNVRVVLAYAILLGCTLLTMLALRVVPLSMQNMLEATGYIYVALLGYFVLGERISRRKALGIAVIILGVFVYSL